jgi:predicted GH43/DUF377 family glycosyl hydrolase
MALVGWLFSMTYTPKPVKVSADDTHYGYLNGKLVAGSGITLTPGAAGDQTLTIAADGCGPNSQIVTRFFIDGRLAVLSGVGGSFISPSDLAISAVYIQCQNKGASGSTIVDVNINGDSIYWTQANRPTLAYNDADGVAKGGAPTITQLSENDVVTIDIDQVAAGAEGLTVIIAFAVSDGGPDILPPLDGSLNDYKIGSTTDNIVLSLGGGGTWDSKRILHANLLRHEDKIYLYYAGQNASDVWRIGVAVADVDGFTGKNFTKYASNPIVDLGGSGAWDQSHVFTPFVIYDSDDDIFKMWYGGIGSSGDWKIGYATASNPLGPWTKYVSNPVLSASVAWEGSMVHFPAVLKLDDGTYRMMYGGHDFLGYSAIGTATSDDGITWTKYGSNPVISASGSGWMASSTFGSRTFVFSGGIYHLYFAAKPAAHLWSKIGYASSPDGEVWTLGSNNPVLEPSRAWEDREVEHPAMLQIGTTRYVYYDCYFGSPATIGVLMIP